MSLSANRGEMEEGKRERKKRVFLTVYFTKMNLINLHALLNYILGYLEKLYQCHSPLYC